MTQNEKELLLKDLCGRLPYDVFVNIGDIKCILQPHDISDLIKCDKDVKPYLFPMSSMTDEQLKSFDGVFLPNGHVVASNFGIDYLNSIHVDYRRLIPMGLALDATGKNIY